MKLQALLICVAVLLTLGLSAQAQDANHGVPGGYVYSNGRNALYYDYGTGATRNLTADLKEQTTKSPLTISEDGQVLTWLQVNKLVTRRLPDSEPYIALPRADVRNFPLVQGKLEQLSLSPGGTHLTFESVEKGYSWFLLEPGNPKPTRSSGHDRYPKYEQRVGEFNGTTLFEISPGKGWQFGNTGFYPPTFPLRATGITIDYEPNKIHKVGEWVESLWGSRTIPNVPASSLIVPIKEAHAKFSIRRDTHFFVWQKPKAWQLGQHFVAFVYKTETGWGPIEIRLLGAQCSIGGVKDQKPGIWEIPITASDFKGLAWKPDGSLTYQDGNKVFSFKAEKIREGIEASGTAVYNEPGNRIPKVIAKDNVFLIKPELVAENINGDRLHWADDNTFLFYGTEADSSLKNIYYWRAGKVETLCSAPEVFSYCDKAPPDIAQAESAIARSNKDDATSGYFYIGGIQTRWAHLSKDYVRILVGKADEPSALQYTLPLESEIKDISDPTGYEYLKIPAGPKESPFVTIKIGQVIIIKRGNKYAAIKPLAIDYKYKSIDELPPDIRKGWMEYKDKGPPPFWDWMTYEWKYWPNATPAPIAKTEKEAPAPSSLKPTSGMGKSFYKPPPWPDSLTPSEFYVTGGDMRITWRQDEFDKRKTLDRMIDGKMWTLVQEEKVCFYLRGPQTLFNASVPSRMRMQEIVPSQLQFSSPSADYVGVFLNTIIVFRFNGQYLAIKPISVSQRYKSFEDFPQEIRDKVQTSIGSSQFKPDGRCLNYEWRYWPAETASKVLTGPLTKAP